MAQLNEFSDSSLLRRLLDISRQMIEIRDLDELFTYAIDQVMQLVGAERGYIVLIDDNGDTHIKVSRKIEASGVNPQGETKLQSIPVSKGDPISHSILKHVIETRQYLVVEDAMVDPRFHDKTSVLHMRLRSIMCGPLISKKQIIGAIYVENRTDTGRFTQNDITPLEFFCNEAAVIFENTKLYTNLEAVFKKLQQSSHELALAYDNTLEAWARALELRDMETAGHSQRVALMTAKIARQMGFSEDEIIHIRRGALLHDIGKMGISDYILLKPGKLTEDEMQLIRMHPIYANDMLSKISFLRPALDIPYCHHEKWDGTGYPRGLAGEQIPLTARIFTVVDVWDALNSDRPYRKAWPREKILKHIREHVEKDFDPNVVDVFFKVLENDKRSASE